MKIFTGFAPGKHPTVPLHARFFSEVLPLVDDLATMKVILFCYWALRQKQGKFRYLFYEDFAQDESLMQGLAILDASQPAEALLTAALARATAQKILLCAEVKLDNATQALYFLNTEVGRKGVEQINLGAWEPTADERVTILPERPTIYQLYEDNIGALTPLIADELRDAEDNYAYEWIVDAIQLAIENNARSWRYIRAILDRWTQEGRANETTGRHSQSDGEFAGEDWADYAE